MPSPWNGQFRAADKFLCHMRLFRDSLGTDPKGLPDASEDLQRFLKSSEVYFVNSIKQLLELDIENSNSITKPEDGTLPALIKEARNEDLDTPPIARTGHFAYGLLDLVQQHWAKPDAIDLAIYVAKTTSHTFLRRKALEVLYNIGRSDLEKIEARIKRDIGSETPIKGWIGVKRRGEEFDKFKGDFPPITVDYFPPITQSRLNTLVLSLEELLVCPPASSKEKDIVQLVPCGHCRQRFAWSTGPMYCDICHTAIQDISPRWPAGRISDIIIELKTECLSYRHDDKPTQQEKTSLVRTFSEPPQAPRPRIDPSRLFKRPNLARRGSQDLYDPERSLIQLTQASLNAGNSISRLF
jgi:hypothetical protein